MATRKRDDSLGEGVYYATESNAGFSRRLLATAVDLLVVILLYVIIGIAYTHAWNYVPFDPFLAFAFVWGIVVLFYLTLLKSSTVRTVGYRVTDLMIVDTNGTRPSFLRMCFRLLLWGFGPFNILVDLLWLGADSEQQSLRDCYAGTCVVRNGATPIGKGPLHLAYYTAIGFTLMYPKVVRPNKRARKAVPRHSIIVGRFVSLINRPALHLEFVSEPSMPLFSRSLYLAVFLFVIGEVTLPLSLANEPALPLVHSLFCDHMVLQRDQLVPVWGWAKPGTQVSVSINGQSTETTVGGDGKWRVAMGPLAAGGPHTMTISGPESVTINDVLVGDVWICSGQSNMQWPVSSSNNADQEVANASYEKIRLFGVPRRISASPESTVDAAWQICSPESIGSFSAVGYFFGRDLHQKLEVPIGLIHSSWGGTVAEAWTSAETLETMDDFRDALKEVKDKVGLDESVERRREETQRIAAWWKKNNATKHDWRSSDFDDSAWKSLQMPQYWDNVDETMKNFDGIVRFRCSFELDEADIDKDLQLALGAIDDVDDTWVNGVRVGGLPQHDKQRNYKVSRQFLIPGPNILSISIYDSGGHGGINATGATFAATIGDREISLAGDWKYEVAAEKKKLSRFPRVDRNNPNIVTVLYNGMIAPLGPFGIRGAIWYQGESNASRPIQYRPLLSRMIGNWRSQFENDKFPFLIVQLANYKKLQTEPVESGWAEIRESQQRIADADPYVGITVITDIGDADDIHPRNKQDVGKRLALSAMSIAYGRDLVSSGPIYRSHQINGQEVRLQLDCADGGLDVRGDQILGFAIAGDDGNYVWAEATLDGNEVVLTAPKGMAPKSIRYNWADNPIGNLFNKQGLPTAPFRTDVPE